MSNLKTPTHGSKRVIYQVGLPHGSTNSWWAVGRGLTNDEAEQDLNKFIKDHGMQQFDGYRVYMLLFETYLENAGWHTTHSKNGWR